MTRYHDISSKANKVLNIILLAFVLILIRVWYLCVIQKDFHEQQARRPQRKSVIERADRATIRDRFNIPMAMNKIQYNVSVCYSAIRQEVPAIVWRKDENGKSVRVQARVEYVEKLSKMLSEELGMPPGQIEDLIHCRASLFPQTPYVIQADLTEEQYYRLRMEEKNWAGLHMEKVAKRYYPQGKIGSDVIGYMGSINQKEYEKIAREMHELEEYVKQRDAGETPILPRGFSTPMQARQRLFELQDKSYTINDLIGRAGIESSFDEHLRGFYGKKNFEVDVKGNFIRELPGSRKIVPGQRILLSISSELQAFAEALLSQYETPPKKENTDFLPWIKGGAIVAMLPKTGEVVAMATSPRFDPNDFVPGQKNGRDCLGWLETESYIGDIWDGKRLLNKEYFSLAKNSFYEYSKPLTWSYYLDVVLSEQSAVKSLMKSWSDIRSFVTVQRTVRLACKRVSDVPISSLIDTVFDGMGSAISLKKTPEEIKKEIRDELKKDENASFFERELHRFFSSLRQNNDKILAIDLTRIVLHEEDFSDSLLHIVGKQSIDEYRDFCQIACLLRNKIEQKVKEIFHDTDFKEWRNSSFKDFLKQKRAEEKLAKRYPKPYLDYLNQKERGLFREFWQKNREIFLEVFFGKTTLPSALFSYQKEIDDLRRQYEHDGPSLKRCLQYISALPKQDRMFYLNSFRSFSELREPISGKYRFMASKNGVQIEKDLASAFYPKNGFGYAKSMAYRQSTPLGSVFKLITSYQSLVERYEYLKEHNMSLNYLNPLTLIDDQKGSKKITSSRQILGYTLDGQTIHRLYKGGILPRAHPGIGKIDLIGALEKSSNMFFSILAGEHLQDPNSLVDASKLFGFGEKSGIDLPGEYNGQLPDDISFNKTGLYAFAIGQHSLVVTPLQAAVMISAIASEGRIFKPKIVQVIAGKQPVREQPPLFAWQTYPFKESLALVGIRFPIFTEALEKMELTNLAYQQPEVRRTIFMPPEIRSMLLDGMYQVVNGPAGTARPSNIFPDNYNYPVSTRDYIELQKQITGKTGTAEILYKHTLDEEIKAEMKTHVWFSAISFPVSDRKEIEEADPEIVVVVYLRFASAGKEAGPISAQIIKKWREICAKHGVSPSGSSSKLRSQINEHFDDDQSH